MNEQSCLDAVAAIEGVAQELDALGLAASAESLRHATDILTGERPEAQLPPADESTKRIVGHAWQRFQRGAAPTADASGRGSGTGEPSLPKGFASAVERVREVRADLDAEDGDRRGVRHALYEAEQALIELVLASPAPAVTEQGEEP